MFKIKNLELKNRVVLAPMAGICNSAYRTIIKEMGCGLIYAEMVSDKAISFGNEKTIDMFQLDISIGLNKDNKKVIQYDPGNKELLINILLIMHDSYYTSTIGQRPGIDMHR